MYHSAGDRPGAHRSPIVAPDAVEGSLEVSEVITDRIAGAPHEWAGARAGQSIRWASATMIPSGPRTYAMRQMCSY
jgi:hypothetical protein